MRGCLPFADIGAPVNTFCSHSCRLCCHVRMGVGCCVGIEGWIPVRRFQAWQSMLPPPGISNPRPSPRRLALPPRRTLPAPPPAAPVKFTSTTEEMATQLQSALHTSSALPPEIPVKETIGKCLGLMRPQSQFVGSHAAIPLLQQYAMNGCPVDCGPDWTQEKILLLLQRGPHQSARLPPAVKQLREETKEKCAQGYARVVRWGDIKHKIPRRLKISPVAMIPHKSKPYRCILDLSFTLFHRGKKYTSVNSATKPHSLPQSMTQLGNSIHRILNMMARHFSPSHPFNFAKLSLI